MEPALRGLGLEREVLRGGVGVAASVAADEGELGGGGLAFNSRRHRAGSRKFGLEMSVLRPQRRGEAKKTRAQACHKAHRAATAHAPATHKQLNTNMHMGLRRGQTGRRLRLAALDRETFCPFLKAVERPNGAATVSRHADPRRQGWLDQAGGSKLGSAVLLSRLSIDRSVYEVDWNSKPYCQGGSRHRGPKRVSRPWN